MDDTDKLAAKIAAAIFAAAKCAASEKHEPKDYLDQYAVFTGLMIPQDTPERPGTVNASAPVRDAFARAEEPSRRQMEVLAHIEHEDETPEQPEEKT